jgi:hypothetical protein
MASDYMSRLSIIRIFFFLFFLSLAKHIAARPAPQVVAIFPLGLAKGSSSQIEIIGRNLEGVYGVWSATQGLKAEVKKVEQLSGADKSEIADAMERREQSYRVTVELRLDGSTQLGHHWLRVVSPHGMSNAHPFVVTSSPVALENTTKEAGKNLQPISAPIILSGRLQEKGETDYFAFDAKPGEAISFHAVSNQATKSGGFDAMQLTLYEAGGSWFDRNRPTRLRFSDDARMTYKFTKAGRYLLQVSGFLGISGPDVVYLVNIAPAGSKRSTELPQLQTPGIELVKREFTRTLEAKRVETLLSRTVAKPPLAVNGPVALSTGTVGESTQPGTAETSPYLLGDNVSKHEVDRLELPLFLEGAIDRSGKIDSYKLMVKAGQQLAFEIETPETTLPEFSPKLDLLDADGQEVFNNIWRRVGGDNNQWMKTLQAKTMYTFNKDGEYTLRLQDMTPRNGDASFKYRILVRPVVPHVGKIEVKEDGLNLAPGQAKKLTVTVEQEEGYSGEVALSLENLPKGLQSSTAAEVPPDPEPLLDQGKRHQYVPKSQKVTLLLIGSEDAPATTLPQVVRLVARPVVQGQVGAPVWTKEIPVMVLQADPEAPAVKRPIR